MSKTFKPGPRGDKKPANVRGDKPFRGPKPDRHGKHAHSAPRDGKAVDAAAQGDGWICGQHAVRQALNAGRRPVMEVLLALSNHDVKVFQEEFPLARVQNIGRTELDKMFPDSAHQGVAARVGSLPQTTLPQILSENPTRLVALDQVTDPHNVGAILRSCAAFGVQGVLMPERRNAGITPVVAKTAAGALETVPVAIIGNLANSLEVLQDKGFTVIGLAGEGEVNVDANFNWPEKTCLVLGSEGEGLRLLTRKLCDYLVRIPMSPAMESLNVSVATGVVLAHMYNASKAVTEAE